MLPHSGLQRFGQRVASKRCRSALRSRRDVIEQRIQFYYFADFQPSGTATTCAAMQASKRHFAVTGDDAECHLVETAGGLHASIDGVSPLRAPAQVHPTASPPLPAAASFHT